MPTNLFMGDTEFPKFKEGQSSDEKIDAILDYLRLMQEQLRYTLAHVGDSNINTNDISGLIKTVNKPVITVVEDSEKKMHSEISQMADSIKLSVDNDGEEISITLSVGEDGKSTITLSGLVTFTALEEEGSTVINGGNITTGTITGITINGCQVNCKSDGAGSLNFVDTTINNGEGDTVASMYLKNESSTDNVLILATAEGDYGKNNHILIHSYHDLVLRARRIRLITEGGGDDEGVYVNGNKIG